ncbi:MAG: hypothetical protein IPL79_18200 [Myxococcales bacterium]|nr:hypothetical protein [Myxococcales bacterium]
MMKHTSALSAVMASLVLSTSLLTGCLGTGDDDFDDDQSAEEDKAGPFKLASVRYGWNPGGGIWITAVGSKRINMAEIIGRDGEVIASADRDNRTYDKNIRLDAITTIAALNAAPLKVRVTRGDQVSEEEITLLPKVWGLGNATFYATTPEVISVPAVVNGAITLDVTSISNDFNGLVATQGPQVNDATTISLAVEQLPAAPGLTQSYRITWTHEQFVSMLAYYYEQPFVKITLLKDGQPFGKKQFRVNMEGTYID